MKRIGVECALCGKNLFFSIDENQSGVGPIIEIKCYDGRCKAINIIDYRNPNKLIVSLKKE